MPFSMIIFQVKVIYCVICNAHWCCAWFSCTYFIWVTVKLARGCRDPKQAPASSFPFFLLSAFQTQMCPEPNSLNTLPRKGHLLRKSDLNDFLFLPGPCPPLAPEVQEYKAGQRCCLCFRGALSQGEPHLGEDDGLLASSQHIYLGCFCSSVPVIFFCCDLFWWSMIAKESLFTLFLKEMRALKHSAFLNIAQLVVIVSVTWAVSSQNSHVEALPPSTSEWNWV